MPNYLAELAKQYEKETGRVNIKRYDKYDAVRAGEVGHAAQGPVEQGRGREGGALPGRYQARGQYQEVGVR